MKQLYVCVQNPIDNPIAFFLGLYILFPEVLDFMYYYPLKAPDKIKDAKSPSIWVLTIMNIIATTTCDLIPQSFHKGNYRMVSG